MSQPMPRWLKAKIASTGRKATLTNCECGLPVLTGLDGDGCAYPAVVEPVPLTYPGELGCALSEGRTTYAVMGGELHRRNHHDLQMACAFTVMAEHRCEAGIRPAWILTTAMRAREAVSSYEPPF